MHRFAYLTVALVALACDKPQSGIIKLPEGTPPPVDQPRDLPPVALNAQTPVEYPPALFDQGIEGTVILRLYADTAGVLVNDSTRVQESSGFPGARFRRRRRRAEPPLRPGAPRRQAGGRLVPAADLLPPSGCRRHHAVTEPPHRTPYDNVLDTIGWTPLIRLGRVGAGVRTPVYGKAEYANPGGSVKDRIGLAIIEDAERRGELKPGGTIVEGTSGNTGVGLAVAAALKGYHCIFTMPDKMSQEKVRLLKAYGAEVVITPTAVPPDHPDNYVMKAKQIVKDTPGAVLANQFYNMVNPEAHYRTTGPEIWEQTGGKVTHFVAGAGTGGTVSGAGKFLKEQEPQDPRHRRRSRSARSTAAGPAPGTMGEGAPYKVEGIGGDKIPTTILLEYIDEFRQLGDRESMAMARRLAREEGMLVGGSAGTQRGPRPPGGARGGRSERLCRHHPLRYRRALPQQALQRRVDAGEPAARGLACHRRRPPGPPPGQSPGAGEPGSLGAGPPGPRPDEHLGREPDSGAGGRALHRHPDRGHGHDPGARPAGAAGPAGARGDGSFAPVVDAGFASDRLAPMLTRELPAALVEKDGVLIGIVSRYDVLREMIGAR